jgi:hypothetical protein
MSQVEFALAELFFRSFRISDVSNEGTEDPILAEFERHDFQLDGKLHAAAADGGDLDAPPQQRTFARGQEMPHAALVCHALRLRNDQFRHALADRFAAAPAEHDVGLLVPTGDCSGSIHRDDGIQRGVDDQSCSFLGFA